MKARPVDGIDPVKVAETMTEMSTCWRILFFKIKHVVIGIQCRMRNFTELKMKLEEYRKIRSNYSQVLDVIKRK
jgi:hypothetical protein